MKKSILILIAVISSLTVAAQDSIPNGGFEYWSSGSYDIPQYYPNSSNPQSFYQCHTPFNIVRSTDAYQGTYAIELTTQANATDTCGAYFLNATNANGNPSTWTGGIPYSEQATGIRGYYKYNVSNSDSGLIVLVFKYGGVSIGTYFLNPGGLHTTYTLFDYTFNPPLPMAPDTVIFAAASSNLIVNNGVAGSQLILDSISFTGVATQPTMMNGDFELWQTQTLYSPDNWYMNGGDGSGVSRSSDAAAGAYAIELQTYTGDVNGSPAAQPGIISNNYWDNACLCQKGGSAFTNSADTLAFSYKYLPADPSDSAQIMLTFKSNGSFVGSAQMYLTASAGYSSVELPFNIGVTPDTVYIMIQSSLWTNASLIYIGSDLKIDDMHFKTISGTTIVMNNRLGKSDYSFYPNPFSKYGTLEINPEINLEGLHLNMYDVLGKNIRSQDVDSHKIILKKNNLPEGLYFYELVRENKILATGKVVVE